MERKEQRENVQIKWSWVNLTLILILPYFSAGSKHCYARTGKGKPSLNLKASLFSFGVHQMKLRLRHQPQNLPLLHAAFFSGLGETQRSIYLSALVCASAGTRGRCQGCLLSIPMRPGPTYFSHACKLDQMEAGFFVSLHNSTSSQSWKYG